jgi:hypothetical protein
MAAELGFSILRQSSPFNPAYAQAEGAARGFKVKTMRRNTQAIASYGLVKSIFKLVNAKGTSLLQAKVTMQL